MHRGIDDCSEAKIVIDSRAIIDPSAKIAANVEISPFAIIGPNVEIGEGTFIGPNAHIHSNTKIGRNNKIHAFTLLGGDPQHTNYKGEPTFLEIGDENIIREFCTINRGTPDGHGVTRIGNRNFLMTYVHIAHDCIIGNEVVMANNAGLAGHVTLGNYVVLGAFCGAHQFATVGDYSFLGRCSKVGQDIPPYMMVIGEPGTPRGVNLVGLKRRGFSDETIRVLRRAYSIVYRKDLPLAEALEQLQLMVKECAELQPFIEAIQNSKRGIAR